MPPAEARRSAGDTDALRAAVDPVVLATGFDLEDLTVAVVGRKRLVRVVVDADGGVDLDGVATVSRAISDELDRSASFDGPFVLEVTSPGVDRPLTAPRHWRRAAGRLVQVQIAGSQVTGRVLSGDDQTVRLDVDGTPRTVAHTELGAGRIQVEFTRRAGPTGAAGEEGKE